MDLFDIKRSSLNAFKIYAVGLSSVIGLAIAYYYSGVPVSNTQSTDLSVVSLVLSNVLFPVTIIVVILYTHTMIKDRLLTSYHKLVLLLIELLFLVIAMILAGQAPIFECNIIGCAAAALPPPETKKYNDDYNERASGTNGLVISYLIIVIIIIMIFIIIVIIVIIIIITII